MLARWIRDRLGSLPTLFALAFPFAIASAGAAIDLSRALKARQEVTRAIEGAALAAASLSNARDYKVVIEDYLRVNLANSSELSGLPEIKIVTNNTLNSRQIKITASTSIPSTFLHVFNIDDIPVHASVSAFESNQDIEISMVLDISSSMRGAKLTNLVRASNNFVDTVLKDDRADYTSINLVPFGGTVNIGDDLFDEFAVSTLSGVLDPSAGQYGIGEALRRGKFRFSDGETCVEHPSADFDDDAVLPAKGRPQVPDVWKWNKNNPWCPPDKSAAIFNSNNATTLRNRITEMVLSDGTGMDIGALWGYKALSPKWRGKFGGDFPSRPKDHNNETIKVMVIMTDGNITAQYRPVDWSTYTTKNGNQQTPIKRGNTSNAITKDTAIGQFKQICSLSKDEKIVIYTVGFRISKGGLADRLLTDCASDVSKYFFVESMDIETAFASIAASINALRISG